MHPTLACASEQFCQTAVKRISVQGAEKIVNVAGPLICLWANLLNKRASVSAVDTLLLTQKALVLLTKDCLSLHQP